MSWGFLNFTAKPMSILWLFQRFQGLVDRIKVNVENTEAYVGIAVERKHAMHYHESDARKKLALFVCLSMCIRLFVVLVVR